MSDPKALIESSLKIIQAEIENLSTVSASGSLDPQQARTLTEFIKVLVVIDKHSSTDTASDLSDEALVAAAREALAIVQSTKESD